MTGVAPLTTPALKRRPPVSRRRRLGARAFPLLAVALVSLVAGVVVGAGHQEPERKIASSFLAAWTHADYATMHALLLPSVRERYPLRRFAALYRDAASTA